MKTSSQNIYSIVTLCILYIQINTLVLAVISAPLHDTRNIIDFRPSSALTERQTNADTTLDEVGPFNALARAGPIVPPSNPGPIIPINPGGPIQPISPPKPPQNQSPSKPGYYGPGPVIPPPINPGGPVNPISPTKPPLTQPQPHFGPGPGPVIIPPPIAEGPNIPINPGPIQPPIFPGGPIIPSTSNEPPIQSGPTGWSQH